MFIATFYQFGLSKFCPKQEIINVITQSKEAYELDTSYKFMINNTDIKIQKCVLFATTNTTFQ